MKTFVIGRLNLMKYIVITGSTRGIGYGLTQSFLARGCFVMISGRKQSSVVAALSQLRSEFPDTEILGQPCDVRQPDQIQALWDHAAAYWGKVDIWINNAGISGDEVLLWEMPAKDAAAVIETNILGTLYGAQVAVRGMLQQGSGAIYNLEGMGSDGRMHSGLTAYGTSKYAISYFTRALAKELKDEPILVGSLRPGMVLTALLTDSYRDRPEEFERAKRIFNIIAERIETVTPWLVDRMLSNRKSGIVLSFSSRWKLMWRFMTAPFVKRNLFDDE
jgi:NAD(P)-dependent dehydrogenase (short-subunit alcohol dehydrogenase family)